MNRVWSIHSRRRRKQGKSDTVDAREKEESIVLSQMWRRREEKTITAYVIIQHRNKEWNRNNRDLPAGTEEYSIEVEEDYSTETMTTVDVL
jgi:hypothetical protein